MRLLAENLTLERGGRRLVAGLSFALGAGEALIVSGPNGAGKSSLLRGLAGLLGFAAGHARLDGGAADLTMAEQLHYLGHADSLKGALTARENLSFWAALLGGGALSETEALRRLGLPHVADFPVRALSAGQQRRVALARLFVAARPLWLLDEPTTALDAAAQDLFAAAMSEHLAGGGLIVAATHAPLGLASARSLHLAGGAVAA
ncbi:MAG TPA: heme ABC exporter ATP-binding protein CcmA [Roseiarcus sp.]|nr:heme ABC exporter ATP-binding protein CcmA [Roseiarcus sp.]